MLIAPRNSCGHDDSFIDDVFRKGLLYVSRVVLSYRSVAASALDHVLEIDLAVPFWRILKTR